MAISRQKEARSRDYALLLFRMTSRDLYSAQYHSTLHAFEQFVTLYMHKRDNKYPHDRDSNLVPPGYKPQSIRMSHQETQNVHSASDACPANTRRWPNVGLMLARRRRRWANLSPTLDQRLEFAGHDDLTYQHIRL